MKDWIIKFLGGVTSKEHEFNQSEHKLKLEQCGIWAIKYLTGKNGETTPDCVLYNPYDEDDIIVITSNMTIMPGNIKRIRIAPWCKCVSIKC